MKEEIKEILEWLEFRKNYGAEIDEDDLKLLLDYITNLQEENKKISEQHLATVNKLIETQEENEQLKADYGTKVQIERDTYKTRNEKAIKYIEFEQKYSIPYKEELIELSKILQGSDG